MRCWIRGIITITNRTDKINNKKLLIIHNMNIAIAGTGYVGLVSGTCFVEMGALVTCVDVDAQKNQKLKDGITPIYEPVLEEQAKRNVGFERLKFATNLTEILDDVELVFSADGTPSDEDGSEDLKYVLEGVKQFSQNSNKYSILVTKTTVPFGTAKEVRPLYSQKLWVKRVIISA